MIDLSVIVFTRSVLSSLIPARKKENSDPPASPLFLFFQKTALMVRQHIPVPLPACTGTQHAQVSLGNTYNNAGSIGNKQEELGRLCTVTGRRPHWDHRDMVRWFTQLKPCNEWTQALQERQARIARKGTCPLFERAAVCMELCLGMGQEPVENLWVMISGYTNTGAIVVGICNDTYLHFSRTSSSSSHTDFCH